MKIYVSNKRVFYDYEILEKYQAGLVLKGFEVKAIKNGRMNLAGAYVVIKNNEAWLLNAYIGHYQARNTPADYQPECSRKLLLGREEIKSLIGKTKQKGLTLMPLKAYTNNGKIKLEIALTKGKRKIDKRAKIIERETKRKIERVLKSGFS